MSVDFDGDGTADQTYSDGTDGIAITVSGSAKPPDEQRDRLIPATAGPPWCLYCHAGGKRISRHQACPRCPCPDQLWLATHTAARFGAVLGRRLAHIEDLALAWELGHELCAAGFAPDRAVALAVELEE